MSKYSFRLYFENLIITVILSLSMLTGCSQKTSETELASPYQSEITLAVAPVLNFSGNRELDTIKITDVLFSELQQVRGFAVVPVNRILAEMTRQRIPTIETPDQALKLCKGLGCDAIIIAAITEYNPYYPPIMGVSMQVYGLENQTVQMESIDPVLMERLASPLKIKVNIDPKLWPRNQMQRIYNSRSKSLVSKVKKFAKMRGTGNSPYEWDLYLRSQEYFLRFVWYQAIGELLDKEVERMNPGMKLPRKDDDNKDNVREYN